MAEQPQGHHLHRPHRLSLPSRPTTSRLYPPFPATTPTPTPSKHRLSSTTATRYPVRTTAASSSSLSSLLLLLFSLRSLYSLLPFLRSSPSSFSLFPFSFLVSLLSFLLTLSFSLLPLRTQNPNPPSLSLSSISTAHHRNLLLKSLLLAVVFLLRFQALRYCGTAAMILAELSGNVAARFAADRSSPRLDRVKVRGFFALFLGLLLLSISWDRIECFPLSSVNVGKLGFLNFISPQNEKCVRVWPMLLPFLAGFIGCYERVSISWGTVRELGRKRVRLVSLFYTTIVLFVPAVISMFVFEAEGDSISVVNLGWPLANTVVFGVLLSENYTDEKLANSKDFRREFIITFVCTLVLELFYYPELSLWGLLICGALLGIAVMELDPVYSRYLELGFEPSESVTASIMKSIRHILSERKSRKIALFLLINTCYMVVEFITGFMSNSLGLISDACHMLFDCAALAIGLYASYISRLPANGEYNYGRGRFEVLSGYANAVFLVLVGLFLVLESFERILEPQEISTSSLLTVSIGGLLVNVIGLIFFHDEHHHAHGGAGSCSHSHTQSHAHHDNHHHVHNHSGHDHIEVHSQKHDHHQCNHSDHDHHHDHDKHHDHAHGCHHDHDHDHHHDHEHLHDHGHHHNHVDHHDQGNLLHGEKDVPSEREKAQKKKHLHIDHNMEGIFLHVLADTLGSLGVVVSTLLIQYKGWLVADPACSIFISALIVSSVIPLLRNSAEILLQRVPRAHEQELNEAVRDIRKTKGVRSIQKLHVWSLTNTDVVGTLQLQVDKDTDIERTKTQVSNILRDAGVKDLTLQLEHMQSS